MSAAAGKRAPPPPPAAKKPGLEPPKQFVIALYDYTAQVSRPDRPSTEAMPLNCICIIQAAGDLSFSAGDRIEVVEKTASTEDWWTGIAGGVQGIFPGYVEFAWMSSQELTHGFLRLASDLVGITCGILEDCCILRKCYFTTCQAHLDFCGVRPLISEQGAQ